MFKFAFTFQVLELNALNDVHFFCNIVNKMWKKLPIKRNIKLKKNIIKEFHGILTCWSAKREISVAFFIVLPVKMYGKWIISSLSSSSDMG